VPFEYGTDDTTAIQAALNAGGHVFIPASSYISATLVQGSNTWLDVAPSATIKFPYSVTANTQMWTNYAAANPQRTITGNGTSTGGSMTSGSATLTLSGTATFTQADVGREAYVPGALGTGTILCAPILGLTSTTTATLGTAAAASVSYQTVTIYTRDKNVVLTGGTWDNNMARGNGSLIAILMHPARVDKFEMSGAILNPSVGSYCVVDGIYGEDLTDANFTNIYQNLLGSGVSLIGPLNRINVSGLYGWTTDEFTMFGGWDYTGKFTSTGSISNVLVENLEAMPSSMNGWPPGNPVGYAAGYIPGHAVGVIGSLGTTIKNFTVRHVRGTFQSAFYAQDSNGDSHYPASFTTDLAGLTLQDISMTSLYYDIDIEINKGRNILIDNYRMQGALASAGGINLGGQSGSSATFDVVTVRDWVRPSDRLVTQDAGLIVQSNATVTNLIIRDVEISPASTSYVPGTWINIQGTVQKLSVDGMAYNCPASTASVGAIVQVASGGTLTNYQFSNVNLKNALSLFYAPAGTIGAGSFENVQLDNTYQLLETSGPSLDITLTNIHVPAPLSRIIRTTNSSGVTTVKVRGRGIQWIGGTYANMWANNSWSSGTSALYNYNPDFAGPPPAISSCGSGSPATSTGSNNLVGQVTVGSGSPTACTLTHATSFTNTPACEVTGIAGTASITSQSNTALVLSLTSGTTGVNYNCRAVNE
jgi:hypothetical protein